MLNYCINFLVQLLWVQQGENVGVVVNPSLSKMYDLITRQIKTL